MRDYAFNSMLSFILCASFVPLYSMELAEYDGTMDIGNNELSYSFPDEVNKDNECTLMVPVNFSFNETMRMPSKSRKISSTLPLFAIWHLKTNAIEELNVSFDKETVKLKCINDFEKKLDEKINQFQNTFLLNTMVKFCKTIDKLSSDPLFSYNPMMRRRSDNKYSSYDVRKFLHLMQNNILQFTEENDNYETILEDSERIKNLCETGKCTWGKNGFRNLGYFIIKNNLTPSTKQCWESSLFLLCFLYQLEEGK